LKIDYDLTKLSSQESGAFFGTQCILNNVSKMHALIHSGHNDVSLMQTLYDRSSTCYEHFERTLQSTFSRSGVKIYV